MTLTEIFYETVSTIGIVAVFVLIMLAYQMTTEMKSLMEIHKLAVDSRDVDGFSVEATLKLRDILTEIQGEVEYHFDVDQWEKNNESK